MWGIDCPEELYISGGGGVGGVGISRFPYLVLPVAAHFLRGSHICVLFLLQNIAQCCEIHFLLLPTSNPLGFPSPTLSSPTSHTLPTPITPGFPPPCPLNCITILPLRTKNFGKIRSGWTRLPVKYMWVANILTQRSR